ncbi:MAG: acyl-CoA dehydrogenase family protein [Planctomycetes bacterium]|nr:acyl-CoA dehydrogenase family protein [Planctomycetota bacterium]
MDFDFTEEQLLLRESARKFLEKEIKPAAVAYGDARIPREMFPELFRKLRPFSYMGETDDLITAALLSEELARVFPALEGIMMINSACARYIQAGPHDLRERALPALLAGEKIGCVAITEPNVGSNPAAIETRAVADGDDYVINGRKTWISNGELSDYAIVICQTDPAKGKEGICPIIVERERSAYEARDLPKLGLKAFATSELVFTDCRVPRENRLGGRRGAAGAGLKALLQGFQWARCRVALMALGIAQAAFEAAVDYARQRRQFGKPIGAFQLIQDMVTGMATEIDAARLLTYRAVHLVKKGLRCDRETSMAKAYATEMAVRTTSRAVQIHGAYGLSPEYLVERYFRDARTLTIPDGTTEIQKLIIGRSVLGLSAFR